MQDYDAFFCLGADVLDGYYNVYHSVERIHMASIAAEGKLSTILGFSFNKFPKARVIEEFNKLPSSVKVFSRDPVSFRRFKKAAKTPIQLVSDVAFLLEPKIAYLKERSKDMPEEFVTLIKKCIAGIDDDEKLKNFKTFFEAMVAYNKKYGGD